MRSIPWHRLLFAMAMGFYLGQVVFLVWPLPDMPHRLFVAATFFMAWAIYEKVGR